MADALQWDTNKPLQWHCSSVALLDGSAREISLLSYQRGEFNPLVMEADTDYPCIMGDSKTNLCMIEPTMCTPVPRYLEGTSPNSYPTYCVKRYLDP